MQFFLLLLLFFSPTLFASNELKIPRIIHWFHEEKTPLSPEEIQGIKSWQKLHPDWKFQLWTKGDAKLTGVQVLKIDAHEDLSLFRKNVLQKTGGVSVALNLIACKRLEPLIREYDSFKTEDGTSVIGCSPHLFDEGITLPADFILPDQIFILPKGYSTKSGVCFWSFKNYPHLTEEMRKNHAAIDENANSNTSFAHKINKIKQYGMGIFVLAFLNGILISYFFPYIRKYWKIGLKISLALLFIAFIKVGSVYKTLPKLNDFSSYLQGQEEKIPLTQDDLSQLDVYSDLFSKHFSTAATDTISIPHTIHLIWGGKPFPKESVKNILSWQKHHPTWTMKFWTDDPNRPLPIEGMEKHLFDEVLTEELIPYFELSTNWGEKSDLLRYEILKREGGVYVDHDVECFQSFDTMHSNLNFYASMEPVHLNMIRGGHVIVTNCIIGASPNHPVFEEAIIGCKKNWAKTDAIFPENDRISCILRTIMHTFQPFDDAVRKHCRFGKTLILPPSWTFSNRYSPLMKEALQKKDLPIVNHIWSSSWYNDLPECSIGKITDQFRGKIVNTHKLFVKIFYFSLLLFILLSSILTLSKWRSYKWLKKRSFLPS